jgi:hypothetical protein
MQHKQKMAQLREHAPLAAQVEEGEEVAQIEDAELVNIIE